MKKLVFTLLAVTFMLGAAAFAQPVAMSPVAAQADANPPLMTLHGTIKADGDKYTFVNDKDGKSWDIKNPEAVKGHEGHHVELSAHVYADQNYIHIMSVKMRKAKGSNSMSN
jgi:hypothetical protein